MKGQIADKLNTEERRELKDEDFGIPETREFQSPTILEWAQEKSGR